MSFEELTEQEALETNGGFRGGVLFVDRTVKNYHIKMIFVIDDPGAKVTPG